MSIPRSDSVWKDVNLYTKPPQHHQISPTIFVCVPNHHTTSNNTSHSNREIIDISDDDEDENTCKNGTSIDDCRDEDEIEVIQLSDDDEVNDEVNDELSGENMTATLDKHNKIHQQTCDESSLDLTIWLQAIQSIDIECSSASSTSQTVHQPLLCPEQKEDNRASFVSLHTQNKVQKVFQCPLDWCKFVPRSNLDVKQHEIFYSQVDILRSFRCIWPNCDHVSSYRGNVMQHVQRRHLNILVTNKAAQCDIDPYQFVQKI